MAYLNSIIISTLLLMYVDGAPSDCAQTYQTLMKNLMTLKKSCSAAGFKDCCQVQELLPLAGTGTYELANTFSSNTFGSSKAYAHCDLDTEGGKWTVIQRRINGSVDFYLNWTDYVSGFGNLDGEFWYGLENIHSLTTNNDVELRIELGNEDTPSIIWTYQLFKVGGPETNFKLTIGEGQGTAGSRDSMARHNGKPFSTRDRDNDGGSRNCATIYGGAWWYDFCLDSNLNGKYQAHTPEDGGSYTAGANRLCWRESSGWIHYSKVQMKVRPKRCTATALSTCK